MSRLGLLLAASALLTTIANLPLRAGLDRAGGFHPDGLVATAVEFARMLCHVGGVQLLRRRAVHV